MIYALIAVPLADVTDQDQMRSLIDDAGPVAFAFVLALGVALFFLGRSMLRQLKRVDPVLPPGPGDTLQAADRKVIRDALDRGAQAPAGAPAGDADPGDVARS